MPFELRGETRRLTTSRVEYSVFANTSTLPPVTFGVQVGVASFQDYLTADEADALAAILTEVASAAREQS